MKDLFVPVVDEKLMHPHFRTIYLSPCFQCHRDILRSWADGFIDRDNKFVNEFQTTFNSSFWELYLFQLFKQYNCIIDMNNGGPDFVIKRNDYEIAVEAVIANAAKGAKPEYMTDMKNYTDLDALEDFSEFNRNAMIRISNSICQKYELYKKSYKNYRHVLNRPFVIALAPFHAPYHYFCADVAIRSVLYDYYVDTNSSGKYPDGRPPTKHLGVIKKDNGSLISLGLFNDERMKDVSAVIFNPVATMGKVYAMSKANDLYAFIYTVKRNEDKVIVECNKKNQYSESIFSGLQIYHNPYAQYPIPANLFGGAEVSQCLGYSKHGDCLLYDNLSNILMSRFILRLNLRAEHNVIDNVRS